MATRPVFQVSKIPPFFLETTVEFTYYSGFAITQSQKSIKSLHDGYLEKYPQQRVLEISSKSQDELGVKLSAFNLLIETKENRTYSVEVAFQSSKVFENGGPYKDMLLLSPRDAKKDPRLKTSGRLVRFNYGNRDFSLTPTTYFYNWLYVNTINMHPDLSQQLMEYDAFTDIAFNPEKSINCQAKAAAAYVSLKRNGLLEKALKNKNDFLHIVYGEDSQKTELSSIEQMSLWDKL